MHGKVSLSYTPILLLEPKHFRGVLDFEDHLFLGKIWSNIQVFISYQMCQVYCLFLIKCVNEYNFIAEPTF